MSTPGPDPSAPASSIRGAKALRAPEGAAPPSAEADIRPAEAAAAAAERGPTVEPGLDLHRPELAERIRGPWRVVVEEASMLPAIHAGDWLLVDPTVTAWPRRGAIVVFHEPETGALSIKRVAGRPGDWVPFEGGYLHLGPDEAWLLSDASAEVTEAAGLGAPIDSRRYGPVALEHLVGRAWFRYGPLERFGLLPGRPRPR